MNHRNRTWKRQGRALSCTIKIDGLAPGFKDGDLRHLLEQRGGGRLQQFQLSDTRDFCFARFPTPEHATAARNGLHQTTWPARNGRELRVMYWQGALPNSLTPRPTPLSANPLRRAANGSAPPSSASRPPLVALSAKNSYQKYPARPTPSPSSASPSTSPGRTPGMLPSGPAASGAQQVVARQAPPQRQQRQDHGSKMEKTRYVVKTVSKNVSEGTAATDESTSTISASPPVEKKPASSGAGDQTAGRAALAPAPVHRQHETLTWKTVHGIVSASRNPRAVASDYFTEEGEEEQRRRAEAGKVRRAKRGPRDAPQGVEATVKGGGQAQQPPQMALDKNCDEKLLSVASTSGTADNNTPIIPDEPLDLQPEQQAAEGGKMIQPLKKPAQQGHDQVQMADSAGSVESMQVSKSKAGVEAVEDAHPTMEEEGGEAVERLHDGLGEKGDDRSERQSCVYDAGAAVLEDQGLEAVQASQLEVAGRLPEHEGHQDQQKHLETSKLRADKRLRMSVEATEGDAKAPESSRHVGSQITNLKLEQRSAMDVAEAAPGSDTLGELSCSESELRGRTGLQGEGSNVNFETANHNVGAGPEGRQARGGRLDGCPPAEELQRETEELECARREAEDRGRRAMRQALEEAAQSVMRAEGISAIEEMRLRREPIRKLKRLLEDLEERAEGTRTWTLKGGSPAQAAAHLTESFLSLAQELQVQARTCTAAEAGVTITCMERVCRYLIYYLHNTNRDCITGRGHWERTRGSVKMVMQQLFGMYYHFNSLGYDCLINAGEFMAYYMLLFSEDCTWDCQANPVALTAEVQLAQRVREAAAVGDGSTITGIIQEAPILVACCAVQYLANEVERGCPTSLSFPPTPLLERCLQDRARCVPFKTVLDGRYAQFPPEATAPTCDKPASTPPPLAHAPRPLVADRWKLGGALDEMLTGALYDSSITRQKLTRKACMDLVNAVFTSAADYLCLTTAQEAHLPVPATLRRVAIAAGLDPDYLAAPASGDASEHARLVRELFKKMMLVDLGWAAAATSTKEFVGMYLLEQEYEANAGRGPPPSPTLRTRLSAITSLAGSSIPWRQIFGAIAHDRVYGVLGALTSATRGAPAAPSSFEQPAPGGDDPEPPTPPAGAVSPAVHQPSKRKLEELDGAPHEGGVAAEGLHNKRPRPSAATADTPF
jgi:hypothetical protein